MKRLKNKVAIIYGDGGEGGTVAKEFAKEGPHVYLAGRASSKLEAIAKEISSNGGFIDAKIVDALNETQVEQHINEVDNKEGKIDISFNAMLGITLFLWLVLLHIYYAIRSPNFQDGENIIGSFECLAFCGTALVISKLPRKRSIVK